MVSILKTDKIQASHGTEVEVSSGHELHTNTLKGTTTAGSITVQGEGSATTNLQQGLAKLWVRYQSSAIQDSLNVSSLTDGGTNSTNCTIAFTNNFADPSRIGVSSEFISTIALSIPVP